MMRFSLDGGSILEQGKLVRRNILIAEGKIKEISPKPFPGKKISVKGKIIIPGLIDCHVHARDFEEAYKEDFSTISAAAAKGGITTIFAMPNTDPPITTVKALELERKLAKKCVVNYGLYFCGADNAAEIAKAKNIAGVKIYMDVTTGNMKVSNDATLEGLFNSFSRIAVHAEKEHVSKAMNLIKKTDHALYLCHISSKNEVEMIRKHKIPGKIFAEATPHHLFLTWMDRK